MHRKILFILLAICFGNSLFCQGKEIFKCSPTTEVKGVLYPDSLFRICPSGNDCYQGIRASDNRLTIVRFKLSAVGLSEPEVEIEKSENIGGAFSPETKSILMKVKRSTVLIFTCIEAVNGDGKNFILQPIHIIVKN